MILILADDMGLGDIGCFNGGLSRTPNLDRLVSQSVWFNQGYAGSAVCAPSRAALLTGRYPQRTGVVSLTLRTEPEFTRLKPDEETLADLFSAKGYTTGIIGKWHLGLGEPWHPRQRGFQEFSGFIGGDNIKNYFQYELEIQGTPTPFVGRYLTDEISSRAIDFVRRHHDRPFFLHVAHYAPHRPLSAPEDLISTYVQKGLSREIATVYAMVEIMDRGIGELMTALEELGLKNDTLVIFASDNGPDPMVGPRFNFRRRGTKYEVYEGGIHVPFMISWPGVLAPRSVDPLTHFIDVVPTLMELCQLQRQSRLPLDGSSLVNLLFHHEAAPTPPRFWQWNRGKPNYTHNAAMREAEWKLVRPSVTYGPVSEDSPLPAVLYNLQTDPLETIDVSAQFPERFKQMKQALDEWCREVETERLRQVRQP